MAGSYNVYLGIFKALGDDRGLAIIEKLALQNNLLESEACFKCK